MTVAGLAGAELLLLPGAVPVPAPKSIPVSPMTGDDVEADMPMFTLLLDFCDRSGGNFDWPANMSAMGVDDDALEKVR